MADLQTLLEAFDKAIRLGTMDEDTLLREKRDRLLDDLRKGLAESSRSKSGKTPRFSHFNQGSYAMRTGVRPVSGEYDLDVGVVFDLQIGAHPDPVEVKTWVYEALSRGAREVRVRRSCVTVAYRESGRYTHHVDLAVYGQGRNGQLHLARGMANSRPRHRVWEPADPKGLIERVKNYRDGLEREQFRRVVRFLKRWRDVSFPSEGNAAPVGIGLTVLALRGFRPVLNRRQDGLTVPDDLAALRGFVGWMLQGFLWVIYDGELTRRLPANLPVVPNSNVLLRMSNGQMREFEDRLRTLYKTLGDAQREGEMQVACNKLRSVVGDGFPMPKGASGRR